MVSTRNKRAIKDQIKQANDEDNTSARSIPVCIEYNGNIRQDGETWIHSNSKEGIRSCAKCICEVC